MVSDLWLLRVCTNVPSNVVRRSSCLNTCCLMIPERVWQTESQVATTHTTTPPKKECQEYFVSFLTVVGHFWSVDSTKKNQVWSMM